MVGRVEGKVAFITGAARGQGRSHAVRSAQDGADIIAVDVCKPVGGTDLIPASTPDDLAETAELMNEGTMKMFRPDLENPGVADFRPVAQFMHVLPAGWVEPVDISNAVLFLASDEARYVTGLPMTVDAGSTVK